MRVLVPAFVISELKTAFIMGFCIYLPFLLVDLVVASVLTAMGMVMMPPVVVPHRQPRRVDRLDGAHRVALDAGNLHQSRDRVAGQAEVVLHADLGGVLDLLVAAVERRDQAAGGH